MSQKISLKILLHFFLYLHVVLFKFIGNKKLVQDNFTSRALDKREYLIIIEG